MRILLVEDERKVASLIARTLRENAYTVDIADTGEKALELSGAASYDAYSRRVPMLVPFGPKTA